LGCIKLTYDSEYREIPFSHLKVVHNVGVKHYRYGFQGQEKDDEVKGKGNSYTSYFRQNDPRLGRWLSVDPKTNELPWESPYLSMGNNPISYIDPMGDKWFDKAAKEKAKELKVEYKAIKKVARKGTGGYTPADRDEAKDGLRELRALGRSQQVFNILIDNHAGGGRFTMRRTNGQDIGTIIVSGGSRDHQPEGHYMLKLSHEMKHAYQYLTGEMSFRTGQTMRSVNGVAALERNAGFFI
jgi:RHS repeat-associated protein